MAKIVSQEKGDSGTSALFLWWAARVGVERGQVLAGLLVASCLVGAGSYHWAASQPAPKVPSIKNPTTSTKPRPILEGGARKLAFALAAAEADGVSVKRPEELVGAYLQSLPSAPGLPSYWTREGYALKAAVPEDFCEKVLEQEPLAAEHRRAGLQCHHTDQGMQLTYRLDSVRPIDQVSYPVKLTTTLLNHVPVVRVSLGAPVATCTPTASLSGEIQPEEGKVIELGTVCLPAFAWDKVEYSTGTVVVDTPELIETQFRTDGALRMIKAVATPVQNMDRPTLSWSLALSS